MIRVKLYGLLRLDTGIKELTLEAGSVREVFEGLSPRIPLGTLKSCVVLVGGKPANQRTKLRDGDEVSLLPPVAGG
ncbi:MAG: MoaD/ThiS family protein [Oscillospiraceae bacterium]|nr:MoaD/ThiS family protein [Oscillospiraceae bacterium]